MFKIFQIGICFFLFSPLAFSLQKKEDLKAAKPLWIQGDVAEKISLQSHSSFQTKGELQKKDQDHRTNLKLKNSESFVIQTPPRNVVLVLNSVKNIEVKGFKEIDLVISLKKGSVLIKNNQGKFQVSLDHGTLNVKNSSGVLETQSYSAPIFVSQFKGSLKIRSHLAAVQLDQSQGSFDLQSFKGSWKLKKSEGDLKFKTMHSPVAFQSYKGSVSGYSGQGNVSGSMIPKKVNIETKSSAIRLYFAKSKARVEAQSWEGKVYAPKNFYKDRAGGVYKAYGFIKDRGENSGSVFLKSHSGPISIL